MFILFGSQVRGHSEPAGEYDCAVCGRRQTFSHVVEREFFTLFGIALLQPAAMWWLGHVRVN